MRDISKILERWGNWSKYKIESETGYSRVAAGFRQLLPAAPAGASCSENDALIIDSCVAQLRKKRPDQYQLLFEHYVKNISKRGLGRKLRLSEGMVRIRFQMAEGFIEGCLSMLDVSLDMDMFIQSE